MEKVNCNHNHYFLFDGHARCLHKLFEQGAIGAVTREVMRDGSVEFLIWRDKLVKTKKGRYAGKYRLFGTRSRLSDRESIIFAIELAKQYNVQRIRL